MPHMGPFKWLFLWLFIAFIALFIYFQFFEGNASIFKASKVKKSLKLTKW